MDVNENVQLPSIHSFFQSIGMSKAIVDKHGLDLPLTHNRGSKPIDGIFVTPGLLGHPCWYLSGLETIASNHQCLWIDLPEAWVFGDTVPTGSPAKAWQLKSDDPWTTQRYLKHLQKHCKDHKLFTKIQKI